MKNVRLSNVPPMVVSASVGGFYTFVKHKNDENGEIIPGTTEVLGHADFPNLITNVGMDQFARASYIQQGYSYCCVGSGNQTPSFTDTQLQSLLAQTNNMPTDIGGAAGINMTDPNNMYGYRRWAWRFPDGQAAGNIQEVGIRTYILGNTTDPLMSRALVLDVNGQPTSITVLNDETLDVFWEIRVYVPVIDTTGTITLEGIDYNYTVRPLDVGGQNYGAWWNLLRTGRAQNMNPNDNFSWQSEPYDAAFLFTRNNALVPATTSMTDMRTAGGSDAASYYGRSPSSITVVPYVGGDFYLDRVLNFGLADGNFIGGSDGKGDHGRALLLSTGMFGGYQIVFDKKIPKTDQKKWNQPFRISWARR